MSNSSGVPKIIKIPAISPISNTTSTTTIVSTEAPKVIIKSSTEAPQINDSKAKIHFETSAGVVIVSYHNWTVTEYSDLMKKLEAIELKNNLAESLSYSLTKDNNELKTNVSNLETKLSNLETKLVGLFNATTANAQHNLVSLTKENTELKMRISKLENLENKFSKLESTVEGLTKICDNNGRDVLNISKENKDLKTKISNLESKTDCQHSHACHNFNLASSKEIDELKTKILGLETAVETLKNSKCKCSMTDALITINHKIQDQDKNFDNKLVEFNKRLTSFVDSELTKKTSNLSSKIEIVDLTVKSQYKLVTSDITNSEKSLCKMINDQGKVITSLSEKLQKEIARVEKANDYSSLTSTVAKFQKEIDNIQKMKDELTKLDTLSNTHKCGLSNLNLNYITNSKFDTFKVNLKGDLQEKFEAMNKSISQLTTTKLEAIQAEIKKLSERVNDDIKSREVIIED